jgi:hypothetical protein
MSSPIPKPEYERIRRLEADLAAARADCAQFCGDQERLIKTAGAETVEGALEQIAGLRRLVLSDQKTPALASAAVLELSRELEAIRADLAAAHTSLALMTVKRDAMFDEATEKGRDLAAARAVLETAFKDGFEVGCDTLGGSVSTSDEIDAKWLEWWERGKR